MRTGSRSRFVSRPLMIRFQISIFDKHTGDMVAYPSTSGGTQAGWSHPLRCLVTWWGQSVLNLPIVQTRFFILQGVSNPWGDRRWDQPFTQWFESSFESLAQTSCSRRGCNLVHVTYCHCLHFSLVGISVLRVFPPCSTLTVRMDSWHLLFRVSQSITVILFNAQCILKLCSGSFLKPTRASFGQPHVLAFYHPMIPSPTLWTRRFSGEPCFLGGGSGT